MKQRSRGVLAALILNRAEVVELVVGAVILGLGTGMIGSYLADRFPAGLIAGMGVVLVVAAVAILFSRALRPGVWEHSVKGFALYDGAANDLVPADQRYVFGVQLRHYLKSVLSEIPDLREEWNTQPLSANLTGDSWPPVESAASREIVREGAECFVLMQLSAYLADYFQSLGASDELATIHASDMSDVLAGNRFLKLFTTPIEERAVSARGEEAGQIVTVHKWPDDGASGGRILVIQHGPGNALYERFLLTLPVGSRVRRQGPDRIEIDTERFGLVIKSAVDGVATPLPRGYAANYLQAVPLEEESRLVAYVVQVTVTVRPRTIGLLSPKSWSPYIWLDDWLDALDERLSRQRYFEGIGWDAAETVRHLTGPRVRTTWTQSEQQPSDS